MVLRVPFIPYPFRVYIYICVCVFVNIYYVCMFFVKYDLYN